MSFFLDNIDSEHMFEELLKEERIVILRFGSAGEHECQRLDRMLAAVGRTVDKYFVIAAYETKDVTQSIRKKYNITDKRKHILIFFHKGLPVYLSFCKKPNFQVVETIPGSEELLSLLVMVHQGVTHKKKIINIYGTYFGEKKSPTEPKAKR